MTHAACGGTAALALACKAASKVVEAVRCRGVELPATWLTTVFPGVGQRVSLLGFRVGFPWLDGVTTCSCDVKQAENQGNASRPTFIKSSRRHVHRKL